MAEHFHERRIADAAAEHQAQHRPRLASTTNSNITFRDLREWHEMHPPSGVRLTGKSRARLYLWWVFLSVSGVLRLVRHDDIPSAILQLLVANGLLLRSFLHKGGRASLALHVAVGTTTLVLGVSEIANGRMWGIAYFAFAILILLSFVHDRYGPSDN